MTHSTHQSEHPSRTTREVLHGIHYAGPDNAAASASAWENVAGAIGNTPLFALRRVAQSAAARGVDIFAKGEHMNPGGSVKDRAARAMILEGIRSGRLGGSKTIIDASSGNTGIAYAMLGAALGFPTTVCLPSNAGGERKRTLLAYGARIIETDRLRGTDGAQEEARRLAAEDPDEYFYPDQYANDANWRAHFEGTAPEIWKQTQGRVTHFVAALGTTGTFVGTVRRLRLLNPRLRAIALQPDTPMHGIEGVKHLASARVPAIWDASLADEVMPISTEEAQQMCLRLAREEGLFVGTSSGANVAAAVRLAAKLPQGAVIATILCDTGTRYLNDGLWKEKE